MSRRIVITGASSLIGQAIARRLVAPGDTVLLQAWRHPEACPSFSDLPGVSAEVRVVDLGDRQARDAWCGELPGTEILVNAAALTVTDLLPVLDDGRTDAMLAVNIQAPIALCRAVLPGMTARRRGVIVNVSSVAAARGNRGQSVYAGTKGFIESFTRALAAEYGRRGIRINAVAPGAIAAGSLLGLLEYAGETVRAATAAGRLGTPDDVAAAVAFLCSDEAAYINGKCLGVDGGFALGV